MMVPRKERRLLLLLYGHRNPHRHHQAEIASSLTLYQSNNALTVCACVCVCVSLSLSFSMCLREEKKNDLQTLVSYDVCFSLLFGTSFLPLNLHRCGVFGRQRGGRACGTETSRSGAYSFALAWSPGQAGRQAGRSSAAAAAAPTLPQPTGAVQFPSVSHGYGS